jgi:hypothetical protein
MLACNRCFLGLKRRPTDCLALDADRLEQTAQGRARKTYYVVSTVQQYGRQEVNSKEADRAVEKDIMMFIHSRTRLDSLDSTPMPVTMPGNDIADTKVLAATPMVMVMLMVMAVYM